MFASFCQYSNIANMPTSHIQEVCVFLGNLKDSKNWLSEITKIPRPSKLLRKYRHFFEFMFDLVGFTSVLSFCCEFSISKIHQDSTTEHFFENVRRNQLSWTHQVLKKTKVSFAFLMSGSVNKSGNLGFPKCRDMICLWRMFA